MLWRWQIKFESGIGQESMLDTLDSYLVLRQVRMPDDSTIFNNSSDYIEHNTKNEEN